MKEHTVFRPTKRQYGTTVELSLRSDIIIDDVYTQGLSMVLCSPVHLSFVIENDSHGITRELGDVTVEEILGARGRLIDDQNVKIFRWRRETHGVEVALALAFRIEDKKVTFLLKTPPPRQIVDGIKFSKTGICGFLSQITEPQLCIDLKRVGTYYANHKDPLGFEFSLDRRATRPNRTSERFIESIGDLIHDGYRDFLAENNSSDVEAIARLYDQSVLNGGNTYYAFTGTELIEATKRYPDLLSFRLFPVYSDKSFDEVNPRYELIDGLRRLSGTVFFMQRQPLDTSLHLQLEDPSMLKIIYEIVREGVSNGSLSEPAYVMGVSRLGSMLFDADPDSSVEFVRKLVFQSYRHIEVTFCIQFAKLDRMIFDAPPSNILAGVQGRWTGTAYARNFSTLSGKPYLFLGHQRVLIIRSSPLAAEIERLMNENRRLLVSDLIADLTEDEAGYTPHKIAHLV